MIRILFFGQTRDLVGTDSLTLEANFKDAESIRQHLITLGDKWALALEDGKLLVALNHTIAPLDSPVKSGDEIAFFPPVTGG